MPKTDPFALPATPDEDVAPAASSPIADTVLGDDAFAAVDDEPLDGGGAPDGDPAPSPLRRFRWLIVGGALVALAGGLLAYRSIHRAGVLRDGLARASTLVRLDTAAGYREAATLLEPLASLDPIRAASARAYALAMLFADYRDARAESEAEALLVAPGRAGEVPAEAHLANAALALGRREAGNAMTAAARAGADPLAQVLSARVAFLAANLSAAAEPARTGADAGLPAALALQGDLLRRTGGDPTAARDAYLAALAASPLHPRAAFGLAKLALSGLAPAADAEGALRRLAEDRGTPVNERGRAAIHLAALRVRAGDRAGAIAALDAAGLDAHARTWAEAAVAVAATRRGSYRAVEGAPPPIRSASDDDPGELPAIAPAVLAEPRPAAPAAPPPPRAAPKTAPARHPTHTAAKAKPVKHAVVAKHAAPTKHGPTAAAKKASAKAKPKAAAKPAAKKDPKKTAAKKRKPVAAAR